MIIIECPYCNEARAEEELRYGGEADRIRPADPATVPDRHWTEYLFMRHNPKGLLLEQWCCAMGCGQWFKVQRDTVSHAVMGVWRFDQVVERSDSLAQSVEAPSRIEGQQA